MVLLARRCLEVIHPIVITDLHIMDPTCHPPAAQAQAWVHQVLILVSPLEQQAILQGLVSPQGHPVDTLAQAPPPTVYPQLPHPPLVTYQGPPVIPWQGQEPPPPIL